MAGIPHTNADDLKAVVEKIILSILEGKIMTNFTKKLNKCPLSFN